MSEPLQRNKLYEYKANSNLVLEADRDKRRRDEGSTEVESLHGRLDGVKMGDRNNRVNNTDKQLPDHKRPKFEDNNGQRLVFQSNSIPDKELNAYRPKTKESRLIYEEILNIIIKLLGDHPNDIIRGAADEVIAILRNETLRDHLKLTEVSSVIGKISSEAFTSLSVLSKKLNDFSSSDTNDKLHLDEEIGVAVVFDDEDDSEIVGREDDEMVEGADPSDHANVVAQVRDGTENEAKTKKDDLYPGDVDAYWLQRQLSKFYPDANISAKLADDILSILSGNDERTIENSLVLLLDFDKFEFVKFLLRNRSIIYFCTRYRQAQTDEDKKIVETEMLNDVSGAGKIIFSNIHQKISSASWAQDRIGEYTAKTRKEAMSLSLGTDLNANARLHDIDENDMNLLSSHINSHNTSEIKTLDFESIQFDQGSHFMSNSECELPSKSWRALKKGYEEVHVPAIRPIIPTSEVLASVASLPHWCQLAFEGVKSLNRVQSKMLNAALFDTENILLCAPTGSGKTNVALLCMLNQIGRYRDEQGNIDLRAFKIVYIAPMKALVQECVQNFSKKLAPFGMKVNELSGDQSLTKQQLVETQVIVTTPEKWDIVTRKTGDRSITQLVRLIIIDEIHLLHDDRGPVLEAIVARTLRHIENTQEMIRLVGLSATLPNFEDVAAFLRVNPEKGLFFFDNSYRPVPLQQQYIGITEKKAIKRFQLMNEICYEKVLQHAGKNQVLIFTHSRADTVKTAKALRDLALENDSISTFIKDDSASKEILREQSELSVKNPDVKDLLPFGFAVHHAGLLRSDRSLVEDLFADKHIQVLVSTATLAWGVNLPCHTVIIKGTQIYSPEKGQWVEMSPLDILQMMGRAGRFGLDSEGEGIILTNHSELQYYLSLMNQQLPIESQLIKKLPDMLNAEIVLGNISTVQEAVDWIGYTFYYIRMLRNPDIYQVRDFESDPVLLQRRNDLVHTAAIILDKHGLIKYDRRSGFLYSNALGRIASYYYVNHDSINMYSEMMKPDMSEIEIFRLFSLSSEFKSMFVREEEKLELAKLISRVPIPVKENIEESSSKVNVLLQAYVSRLALEGFSLSADVIFIQQSACRLLRALFEISMRRGWASLTLKLLNVCKMAEKRMWLSQSPLRQFSEIPEMIVRKIEKSSDLSWSQYFDLKPQDLGEIVKIPKMGKPLHKFVHMFPKLELAVNVLPITRSLVKIELKIVPDFNYDTKYMDFSMLFWIFVYEVDGETLLHYESFSLSARKSSEEHNLSFVVTITEPIPPQYFVRVVADRWLASEVTIPISFKNIILPSKFPPATELLDMKPILISSIKASSGFFEDIDYLNPIQTQTFSSVYETDNNVLICAPSGSKTFQCAEMAILRHLQLNKSGKCVVLTTSKDSINSTVNIWRSKFADKFNIKVEGLILDFPSNMRLFDSSDLILSTVESFYPISKRWKQKKTVQDIGLYIYDNLQDIGSPEGHLYEILVSRCRYVSSQLEKKPRIVALSTSLANAREVGEWIGAISNSIYNFHPSARPYPLETHFLGFDNYDSRGRIQSMMKPTFSFILSSTSPSIVYVATSNQAKLLSIDFVTFSKSNEPTEVSIDIFQDLTLNSVAKEKAAYLIDDLSNSDCVSLVNMFNRNLIRALFIPHHLAGKFQVKAAQVIVMDTVFEKSDRNVVDYSQTDLLNILETAHPQNNSTARLYVLCHSSKKFYLKKMLLDPLPIESQLHVNLHDHINSEIMLETIENKQDAVDFLTWTFFYRRLPLNPNYYNMHGTTRRHLSEFLSDLIERVTSDLESAKCISIDDLELRPLNLGMISNYYNLSYAAVELFSASVTSKTKNKGLMEIIASSPTFRDLYIREDEVVIIENSIEQLNLVSNSPLIEAKKKVLALLSSYLSRQILPPTLFKEMGKIVLECANFLPAIVDIISSKGWLKPAIAAMELSQLLTQGMKSQDSVLLQIPHITEEIVANLSSLNPPIETVFDLIDADDNLRNQILRLTDSQMSDVALFCNSYPLVEVAYELSDEKVTSGETVTIAVTLQYDSPEFNKSVVASRFPGKKSMGWWLIVGDNTRNSLLSIKKISSVQSKTSFTFVAQESPGDYELALFLINDSYIGCDQEFSFALTVIP